jgi:hypothetical protein
MILFPEISKLLSISLIKEINEEKNINSLLHLKNNDVNNISIVEGDKKG